jgi:hypothetical protein
LVAAVANLWRVGAAAVAPEDASEEAWSRPLGERGELEREKRTLLKAIKDAEFDQSMGKLSAADAKELITMYRARAIEIIKALEELDRGASGTAREQIERELAARLTIAEKTAKKASDLAKSKAAKAKPGKGDAKAKADDTKAAKDAKADTDDAAKADTDDAKPDDVAAKAETADAAKTDDGKSREAPAAPETSAADEPDVAEARS